MTGIQEELSGFAAQHDRITRLKNVAPNSPEEAEIHEHYSRLSNVYHRYLRLVDRIDEMLQNAAALTPEAARLGQAFRTTRVGSLDTRTAPADVLRQCATVETYLDSLRRELSA